MGGEACVHGELACELSLKREARLAKKVQKERRLFQFYIAERFNIRSRVSGLP